MSINARVVRAPLPSAGIRAGSPERRAAGFWAVTDSYGDCETCGCPTFVVEPGFPDWWSRR